MIVLKVIARSALSKWGLSTQELLPYVLSYPASITIVGISDVSHLEGNIRIASAFEQLSQEEMAETQAHARH